MDWDLIWKAVMIVLGGTVLLRIAGRKSIAQMTLAQTVIMIGIGSLLIQPLADENLWVTLLVGLFLVLTLIIIEFSQIKVNFIEKFITGEAKVIVEDGIINEKNMKKMRLTVDQLEMNLRQQNVQQVEDVKFATLEPNGQVTITLTEEASKVTKKEFNELKVMLEKVLDQWNVPFDKEQEGTTHQTQRETIFTEVAEKGHRQEPPHRLK